MECGDELEQERCVSAGSSKMGRVFGSKYAEVIYVGGLVPSQTAGSITQIRADAVA